MKLDKFVRILGEPWHVMMCTSEVEPRLKEMSGFCDQTSHFIGIVDPKEKNGNIDNEVVLVKQIIRHEIIHAFMYASGLGDSWEHKEYGHDETIVDWIALQFRKIEEVVNEVEGSVIYDD